MLAPARVARPCVAPLHMGLSDWVPKPIKGVCANIFGSGGSKRASSNGNREEGAALFRQLGVSSDADYEEVQEVRPAAYI
jgi:hypothetical protein